MATKVLLVGFGPFLSYTTNPSGDIARDLNGKKIGDAEITGRVLPVEHKVSAIQLHEYAVTQAPDIIIGIGTQAGKGCIALENIAINKYLYRDKTDEMNEPLYEDGKDSYMSTLPLDEIKHTLEANSIPAEYSFSADTWVSNEVFYEIMRCAEKMDIKKAGFIHMPLSHQQVVDMHAHHITRLGLPSMSPETMMDAAKLIITTSIRDYPD